MVVTYNLFFGDFGWSTILKKYDQQNSIGEKNESLGFCFEHLLIWWKMQGGPRAGYSTPYKWPKNHWGEISPYWKKGPHENPMKIRWAFRSPKWLWWGSPRNLVLWWWDLGPIFFQPTKKIGHLEGVKDPTRSLGDNNNHHGYEPRIISKSSDPILQVPLLPLTGTDDLDGFFRGSRDASMAFVKFFLLGIPDPRNVL